MDICEAREMHAWIREALGGWKYACMDTGYFS
jgi:hypothetical protein